MFNIQYNIKQSLCNFINLYKAYRRSPGVSKAKRKKSGTDNIRKDDSHDKMNIFCLELVGSK